MFPVALLVLAAALGWKGWDYVVSSTPTPAVPENDGEVSVYTSDPKAAVELWLDPAKNSANETLPGFQWVNFSLIIEAKSGPVWWALALGGDAAPPPGKLPDSGNLPMPSDGPDDDGRYAVPVGWTFYEDSTTGINAPAFVTRVNWPAVEMEEDRGATIIYGRHPEGEHFLVTVAAQVRKPLMQDNGEYVTISSPRLGWTYEFLAPGESPSPATLNNLQGGESRQGDAASLGRHTWYRPERMQAKLIVDDLVGARQESGTPPVAPFQTEWEAKDSLEVDAVFSRPAKAADNQRQIFLAGVLVSLAASFLVWAAELFVGPRREPVAALQRRSRRSDSDKPPG